MIELKNVFLSYNREYYALFDINLKILDSARIAIVGEAGSGKTALLRCIAGLEEIKKGEIYIDNTPINRVDFEKDVSLGYISSKPVFFESKTVYQNLSYVLKVRNIDKNLWNSQIDVVLNKFGIANLKDEKVGTLCRSDRKIVQIARLALRPIDILLCDDLVDGNDVKSLPKIKSALKILLEGEKKDKIFVLACTEIEYFKDIVDTVVKLNLGSIEDK